MIFNCIGLIRSIYFHRFSQKMILQLFVFSKQNSVATGFQVLFFIVSKYFFLSFKNIISEVLRSGNKFDPLCCFFFLNLDSIADTMRKLYFWVNKKDFFFSFLAWVNEKLCVKVFCFVLFLFTFQVKNKDIISLTLKGTCELKNVSQLPLVFHIW